MQVFARAEQRDAEATTAPLTPAVEGSQAPTAGRLGLRGVLQRFVYRDAVRGFGIATLRNEADGQMWTIKGSLWGVEPGECVQVYGWVEVDPKWGRQFRVDACQPVLPATAVGVIQYLLAAKIEGIGPVLAGRVVEVLGTDALQRAREDPDVLAQVPGLSRKKRARLVDAIQQRGGLEDALLFLLGLGLGPALAQRVLKEWGVDAVRKVRENPHRLADEVVGFGFKTADQVARSLGTAADAPARLLAGLLHAAKDLAQSGHTAPPAELVRERAASVLDLDPATLGDAIEAALASGRLVRLEVDDPADDPTGAATTRLALPDLAAAEETLARRVAQLLDAATTRPSEARVEVRLALAEESLGFALEGTQRDAVAATLQGGLLVVTGGPGTGKTTIVRGVLAALEPDHARVVLAAPTGRAARRLAEATGREAKTVHRLLEFDPEAQLFRRNAERPLDADVIVIDEVSMLEAPLAAALALAVQDGARLLLVGDADQLPSVGPGAVLDDLLTSGAVPAVRLDRIWRQAEGSILIDNAHRVRRGQPPLNAAPGAGDFYLVPRDDADEVVRTLIEIVTVRLPRRFGFDPREDVQVLVPMHRGTLGTQSLNEALRAALNPDGVPVAAGLRAGDKVLQVRNDYDLDVFNGDIGVVVGLASGTPDGAANAQGLLDSEATVHVSFGDREVYYPIAHVENLQLAYAVTVHKAQGSEYPAVVLVLHGQHHMLLQRNLLYTAMTRARRFVAIVGQAHAVEKAARNDAPVRRWTSLVHALCNAIGVAPVAQPSATRTPGSRTPDRHG